MFVQSTFLFFCYPYTICWAAKPPESSLTWERRVGTYFQGELLVIIAEVATAFEEVGLAIAVLQG